MELRHNNCLTTPSSFQRKRNGPWFPEAHLYWNDTGSTGTSFYIEAANYTFPTRQEADTYALQFARAWIDKNL